MHTEHTYSDSYRQQWTSHIKHVPHSILTMFKILLFMTAMFSMTLQILKKISAPSKTF